MGRYIVKRLLGLIPLLLAVSFLIFIFIYIIPGDPARFMAGKDATNAEVVALRASLGLDVTLLKQYCALLTDLINGDLANICRSNTPFCNLFGVGFLFALQLSVFRI